MPLLQRLIEPESVCRNTLPLDDQGVLAIDVPNELECVTNGTLANIIRQLSSLSKHADDIFGSLSREATSVMARTSSLQGRVDRLAVKSTQLDSTVEEVSLQDIHMRKAFKSCVVYDQQVVSRETMPAAMRDTYLICDKPPPLDKLNPYREDGKDGLKFYTDPNYFFELWKQEMLKDTERILHDKGKKPHHRPKPEGKRHKKVRQPHNSRERYRQAMTGQDFLDKNVNYCHMQYGAVVNRSSGQTPTDSHPIRPNSLELHPSYGPGQQPLYSESPKHHYPPPPPAYSEHPMSPQHNYPPPPPYVPLSPETQGTPTSGTPTRQIYRVNTMRPTHPPPAPPTSSSSSSSGSSTPTVSGGGTPSSGAGRYRVPAHSRDNLPPPPPPPEGASINGTQIPTSCSSQRISQNQNNSPSHLPAHSVQQDSRHSTPVHSPQLTNDLPKPESKEPTPEKAQPTPDNLDLPPPPPTPKESFSREEKSSAIVPGGSPPLNGTPPLPPPPPPPPPLPPSEELVSEQLVNGEATENQTLEVVSVSSESASTVSSVSKVSESTDQKSKLQNETETQGDARSDLLAAIREGIKLRRVEDIKQKEVEKAAPLHDVASILARRVAMEFSDSESPSDSEYDSEGWEDENEGLNA